MQRVVGSRPKMAINGAKHQPAGIVAGVHACEQCQAKNPTCHFCQMVGHLTNGKGCLSKLRKNVHEIEVSRSNNALPNSESTQPVSDYVFLGPIAQHLYP